MVITEFKTNPEKTKAQSGLMRLLRLMARDPAPLCALLVIALIVLAAIFGPMLIGDDASKPNFAMRNTAPQLGHGWQYWLGGDNLGRGLLPRLVVGAQTTLAIAGGAVLTSLIMGGALGFVAGMRSGLLSDVIMRLTDVIMSFPSLLTALIVLYLLGPSPLNLIIVLAITRTPVYLRTVRAEVMEIYQRPFVSAAKTMGASDRWLIRKHLAPLALPTLFTIAAVDFASVIIAESGLSFLGLGIQPPAFTWGAMVADGRSYITSAWWLSLFPGLMILVTTFSLALLSNWVRLATDPAQAWRFFRSDIGGSQ